MPTRVRDHPHLADERGLARELSAGRQAMMAIGGAIGTGLFLASGLAVNVAGPGVIFSYIIVALVSILLALVLTEMAVMHPTSGSFGTYAGMYVHPFAGYAVRMSYVLMECIANGAQLVAVSIYMEYWFPATPGALWVAAFSTGLVYLNTRRVGALGSVEYWFSMIKVAAIVVFVALALATIFGLGSDAPVGFSNYVAHGGFLPMGVTGVWFGACFALYSFIGVEIVGVTAGEAGDPERTIPAAMRRMVLGLSAIYVVTVALLIAVLPWKDMGVSESPFVSVLRRGGVPGAASLMNFVVLTAALTSANANLYAGTRQLFSLARAGFVPAALGRVNDRQVPLNAVLANSGGLAAAMLVRAWWPQSAYAWFFGVALFGGLFVWLMIFVTHLAFRRRWDQPGQRPLPLRVPFARPCAVAGCAMLAAMLISTWWAPGLRITLLAGAPWLVLLAVGYKYGTKNL